MKSILILILSTPLVLFAQKKSYGGTYAFGKDINKENVGEIRVVPEADNRAIIYISTTKQAPSYNSFYLLTDVEIVDGKAYFQNQTGTGRLCFEFFEDHITTYDPSSITLSHISLDKQTFKKTGKKTPRTFPRGDGKDIALINSVDDFTKNAYPNTSVWDFIGIWNYGSGMEALTISKNPSSDSFNIQFNSIYSDYQDHFFSNCYFKKGKIYGDFYGAKENVLIEMIDDQIVLSIDPFHEFQALNKQCFSKKPITLFKYAIGKDYTQIMQGNKIVDSLPPGDRINFFYDQRESNIIMSYIKRFNNHQPYQSNLHIDNMQLSTVKPLFIAENIQLKWFKSLNEGERFIQELYSPEQRKVNTVIETISEQNIIGQQKLIVNKEQFAQLELQNIGKPFGQNELIVFITGTVDLSHDLRSLIIDYQYDNEYSTYVVNYNAQGNYVDHLLINYNDYVESFQPITSFFADDAIYVNSSIYDMGSEELGTYNTYDTKRFVLNERGQFIASNYALSYPQTPQSTLQVQTQKIESKSHGKGEMNLFINIVDTNRVGGYGSSLYTTIESESGSIQTIPLDFSKNHGFYYPPYGDFSGPGGFMAKLFDANIYDGINDQLFFEFQLKDINKDGVEDLIIDITDRSYASYPKESFQFIHEHGSWVLL